MNSEIPRRQIGTTEMLIIFVAVLGFAFDIYELLMMPLIAGPALADLLKVPLSDPKVKDWIGYIFWGSAMSGGLFGLLGGWLTDRFGRKRVLVWSIMVYSVSPLAAAFSTSAGMLLLFRCTTFIGVCVEFVAAVAWLAELFPNAKQRETVLGYTQAFSSAGGLLVTGASYLMVKYAADLPAILGGHAPWRYTLLTGFVPALPLFFLLPFLPESPAWKEKRAAGTLKRPSIAALFAPDLRRTTIVTTLLFACAYGAAFGAIQLTPTQIVPGTPQVAKIKQQEIALQKEVDALPKDSPKRKELLGQQKVLRDDLKQAGNKVQFYQEMGGLIGRLLLAYLALAIVSRRKLLRVFQLPGLLLVPLVFLFPARTDLELLKWGMFLAGLLTVAQFSFWGNYLPRAYPLHLRGTGESFAANIGGRMIGTSAAFVTTHWFAEMMPGTNPFHKIALGAALMAFLVYAIGFIASFWLPEPPAQNLEDHEAASAAQPQSINK